jgi:hypothetical protein
MRSKVVSVLAGGTLLFLFNMPQIGDVTFAADQNKGTQPKGVQAKGAEGLPCDIPHGQNATQAEQDAKRGSHVIFGEVIRVDGANYVVKDESGKEVSLQADDRTEKPPINKGDQISANVDDKNHALWIRANRGTDRRTEHASADCDPKEVPSNFEKR